MLMNALMEPMTVIQMLLALTLKKGSTVLATTFLKEMADSAVVSKF